MKFEQGWIENMNKKRQNIVVKGSRFSTKETIIGSILIFAGICEIAGAAFKNGSEAHEAAEFKTMVDLGIIK